MRREQTVFLWMVILSGLAVPAMADVPRQMTVQGILTDTVGVPRAGSFTFTFEIFTLETGGSKVWPAIAGEDQPVATDDDGRWTTQLGAINPLTDGVFASTERWLQITVNDGVLPPVVLPRVKLHTTPFAFNALYADTAGYARSIGVNGWADDGTAVRLSTATDYVGIGTTTPSEPLVIGQDLGSFDGDWIVTGSANPEGEIGLIAGQNAMNYGWLSWYNDAFALRMGTRVAGVRYNNTLVLKDGKIGVGTDAPGFKLEMKSAGTSDGFRVTASDGDQLYRIRESSVGSCEMYVSDSIGGNGVLLRGVGDSYFKAGNVGIGTTTPAGKLHVVGVGNSSVQLPTDAISNGEILDEPGIAYTEISDVLLSEWLPGTLINQGVDFPSPGYALVLATVWAYYRPADQNYDVDVGFCISGVPDVCDPYSSDNEVCQSINNVEVQNWNHHFAASLQEVVQVPLSGTRHFYLVGWWNGQSEVNWVNVYKARMSVLFFPTWYGNNAPPTAMAETGDHAPSTDSLASVPSEASVPDDERMNQLVAERVRLETAAIREEFETKLAALWQELQRRPPDRKD